jgi:hypothetical protein
MNTRSSPDTPIPSEQWCRLTVDALKALGGDSQMVPGAKLRQRMVQLGALQDLDVPAYVQASGLPFSRLVEQVDTVIITRRPGSDILVGLHGASAPKWFPKSASARGELRGDLYRAFTRITPEPFVYLPHSDKFVTVDLAEGESIKVLRVSLDSLIADRRAFVETLQQDEQKPFLAALNHSANPLTQFRNVAIEQAKINQWAAVQAEQLRARVIQWATDNQITPRDAWFKRSRGVTSPHRTLYRLVPYLTSDEIRDLRIPFRAVEAFLADAATSE